MLRRHVKLTFSLETRSASKNPFVRKVCAPSGIFDFN